MFAYTLRQFEVFVTVVEAGGFARAADLLHMAQPSVSNHIRVLERDLGTNLFERQSGRRAVLTTTGHAFLVHARSMLQGARDIASDPALRKEPDAQELAVACQRSLANTVLKRVLGPFARSHPETRLRVRVETQDRVLAAIAEGSADVGYMVANRRPPDLHARVLGRLRYVVCAGADHPLAARKAIRPGDLDGAAFVGPPRGSLYADITAELLAAIGITRPRFSAEATEFGPMRDLTLAGVGLCCALEESAAEDLAAGRLVSLDIAMPPLMADLLQITRTNRPGTPAARALAALLEDAVRAGPAGR